MSGFTRQQREAIAAGGNLLVVAGAGTGKTRTLVARCLRFVIQERASLENILMVTFTEAAAAEMRARIREELHKLQVANPGDEHLSEQLALLDTARICTLHSFCLQLAREHFHELGLDPQFSVLDEQQTRPLMREALDELLEQNYSGNNDQARAVQALVRAVGRGSDVPIRSLVLKLHAHSQALPDPTRWLDEQQARFEQAQPDEWRPWFLDAVAAWRQEFLDLVAALACEAPAVRLCHEELLAFPEHPDSADATRILRAIQTADVDANWPPGTKGRVRKSLKAFFSGVEFLSALLPDEQGNDPLPQDWEWSRQHMTTLVSLTREFTARFTAAKRELAGVDFADLEQFALRLLRDPSVADKWRARLAQVFVDEYQDINAAQDAIITALGRSGAAANRFMVGDVKQSIYRFRLANPKIFQSYKHAWELPQVGSLKKDPSPGLAVEPLNHPPTRPSATLSPTGGEGRVRGHRATGGFMGATTNCGRAISLTGNFRSREALLNFVNPLFAALMRPEIGGVAYDALEFGTPNERERLAAKSGESPCVEFHLIARANDDESGASESDPETEAGDVPDLLAVEREARLVARRLRALKCNSHHVWDADKKTFRDVEWSDMAVLLRSPAGRAEAFAMEFSKAGVPLVAARGGFFASLEVSDLLNLLRLLDNPLQDVPLAAVLRSPLVGLSLDELAQIRAHNTARPFWTALARFNEVESSAVQSPESANQLLQTKVSRFFGQFHRWRELVRQTSLTQCLEAALAETHYESLLLAGARGAERAANVRRLLDLARQFDPYQRQGLYRFLHFVEAQTEEDLDLQPGPSPSENAVRLISIHKSKGLEFPVVALACLGTRFNERDLNEPVLLSEHYGLCPKITPPDTEQNYPSLPHWLARRSELRELRGEELRLLYVAMTRARDTLILTGTTNRKAGSVKWQTAASSPVVTTEVVRARSHLDWLLTWLPHATADENWRDDRIGENEMLRWRIYDQNDAAFANEDPPVSESETDSHNTKTEDANLVEQLRVKLAWQYPFAGATVEAAKTSVSAIRRRVADEEDDDAHMIFDARIRRASPKTEPVAGGAHLPAVERGRAHHLFLQLLDLEHVGTEADLKAEARQLSKEGRMKPERIATLDFAAIAAFWQTDLGRRIRANAGCTRRELAFTARFSPEELATLTARFDPQPLDTHGYPKPLRIPLTRPSDTLSPSGGEGRGEGARFAERTDATALAQDFVVVQGVADLIVLLPAEIWLVDFKTDELAPSELPAKAKLYEPQLRLYALALARIYGRPVAESWLHFLAIPKTVPVVTRTAVQVAQTEKYQQGQLL